MMPSPTIVAVLASLAGTAAMPAGRFRGIRTPVTVPKTVLPPVAVDPRPARPVV